MGLLSMIAVCIWLESLWVEGDDGKFEEKDEWLDFIKMFSACGYERVCRMVYCFFSKRKCFGNVVEKPDSLSVTFGRLMTYSYTLKPYWLPSVHSVFLIFNAVSSDVDKRYGMLRQRPNEKENESDICWIWWELQWMTN